MAISHSDGNGEANRQTQQNAPVVRCWACKTLIQVPVHKGRFAPEFKCGWCHAVSSYGPETRRSRRKKAPSKCDRCCKTCFSYSAVVMVVTLLVSIMALGFIMVLPHAVTQPFALLIHRILVLIMSFNLLFNYAACSLGTPGISDCELPGVTDVEGRWHIPHKACDNYRFCEKCQKPKPLGVHHCNMCGKCIVDMDHHCPFIGNCVGRANLRCFLTFLIWAVIGTGYAFVMTSTLLIRKWDSFSMRQRSIRKVKLMNLLFLDLDQAPWWFLATGYIFAVSLGTLVGVGLLLHSQMVQVIRGQSYISSLKGLPPEEKGSKMMRLRRVFGNGHPITWLMPRWGASQAEFDAARKSF